VRRIGGACLAGEAGLRGVVEEVGEEANGNGSGQKWT
jgi:hypothetical protein